MNEKQAQAIADALSAEAWQSGGDIWLVIIRRDDGKLVVLSDDAICLYANQDAFDVGAEAQSIELHATNSAPC